MRVVLLATDFTELSLRAEEKARELARGLGARVHMVHVVEPIDDPEDTDEETREFHAALEQKASERLQEAAARFVGLEVSYSVVLGHRPQSILRVAEQEEVDLVILGSHPVGEGEPPRVSTSLRVSWFCQKPILLVP